MQAQQTGTFSLPQLAREFAAEVSGAVERKKRTVVSIPGMQVFMLYIRAQGHVPPHQVVGPITVQTLTGHAQFTTEGTTHDMPTGAIIAVAPAVSRSLFASEESVLLVTHAFGAE